MARTREQELEDWPDQYHLWVLVLASFLVLFGELAFIRWLAVEVRVFAYFKNLALLLCFLGFGLGCALASRPVRSWMSIIGTMALLLVVRVPLPQRDEIFENLSTALGGAGDLSFWVAHQAAGWRQFTIASLVALVLLLLLVMIFIPLGQIVSRQMDLAPRALHAYSWNLAGSLGGILAFFMVCRWMMPPAVWMAALLGGMAVLILGAGNGNDAAAALRHGSPLVDAVEIDPGIRELACASILSIFTILPG